MLQETEAAALSSATVKIPDPVKCDGSYIVVDGKTPVATLIKRQEISRHQQSPPETPQSEAPETIDDDRKASIELLPKSSQEGNSSAIFASDTDACRPCSAEGVMLTEAQVHGAEPAPAATSSDGSVFQATHEVDNASDSPPTSTILRISIKKLTGEVFVIDADPSESVGAWPSNILCPNKYTTVAIFVILCAGDLYARIIYFDDHCSCRLRLSKSVSLLLRQYQPLING